VIRVAARLVEVSVTAHEDDERRALDEVQKLTDSYILR
jgi:ribosome recycling factor